MSYEIRDSKRVADALGCEWHCVDYTTDKQTDLFSDSTTPYYEYTRQDDFFSYTGKAFRTVISSAQASHLLCEEKGA